jgi:hypothetical protein
MIDPSNVQDVAAEEQLARYILYSKHVRASDLTIRPDAFIPHPYLELSVTRHLECAEGEIWSIGQAVASKQGKTLYGRADVGTRVCLDQRLDVNAAPLPGNPNHANITGWPASKPHQKILAMVIAARSSYLTCPEN